MDLTRAAVARLKRCNMRQAIMTKFIGPTNYRGAYVKARGEAGSVTVPWNHAIGIEANHKAAALALAQKLDWPGDWIGGGIDFGFCFVQPE
jgi:hypothetical protein